MNSKQAKDHAPIEKGEKSQVTLDVLSIRLRFATVLTHLLLQYFNASAIFYERLSAG